jgi:hypothetical protein
VAKVSRLAFVLPQDIVRVIPDHLTVWPHAITPGALR